MKRNAVDDFLIIPLLVTPLLISFGTTCLWLALWLLSTPNLISLWLLLAVVLAGYFCLLFLFGALLLMLPID